MKWKADMVKNLPSTQVWDCVICAIDPGKVSGVDISYHGESLDNGTDKDYYDDCTGETRQAKSWVWCAQHDAEVMKRPLVFVIEKHNPHGKWGSAQFAGTQRSSGVWEHYIKQLPFIGRWRKHNILWLPVDEWHAGVFGTSRAPRTFFCKKRRKMVADPDHWKRMACLKVYGKPSGDHNAADARLMGEYASRWWRVGKCSGVKAITIGKE